jgi:hypothetical protein
MKHTISLILSEDDFEISMSRKPQGQEEFDEWAMSLEQGLCTGTSIGISWTSASWRRGAEM